MSTVITQDMPLDRKLDLLIACAKENDAEVWRGLKARAEAVQYQIDELPSMDRVLMKAVKSYMELPESVQDYPSVYDVYRRLGLGADEYSHISGEHLQKVFAKDNWPLYSRYAKDIKRMVEGGYNITILGSPGSGKSNALAALLAFDVRNWPKDTWQDDIWFCRAYEFPAYKAELYATLAQRRLLIVDNLRDIGPKGPALVGIINTRTNRQLPTFITTFLMNDKVIEECFPGMVTLMRRGVVVRLLEDNDFRKLQKPAMP